MALTSIGFKEREILEWPMDKYEYYSQVAVSRNAEERLLFVRDVQAGVLSAFQKDGFEKYQKVMQELIDIGK